MKPYLITMLSLLSLSFLMAQKPPEKFGKIDKKLFDRTQCPVDEKAAAYYLFDFATNYIKHESKTINSFDASTSKQGFYSELTRHQRLHILSDAGINYSEFVIPLYQGTRPEKLGKIKAFTYNLVDGKVQKTKLENDNIFEEKTSEYWTNVKFAMPNVRAGSIIEVEYTLKSDYLSGIRDWNFQSTIPIMESEIHIYIPEYYQYDQEVLGYLNIDRETEAITRKVTLTYNQGGVGINSSRRSTQELNFHDNVYRYFVKNVPAFPVEPYLRTSINYISRVSFELAGMRFPGQGPKLFTSDWATINKQLLKSEKFGVQLKKDNHLQEIAEKLKQKHTDRYDLMNAAFKHISNSINWNEIRSTSVVDPIPKTYKQGSGDVTAINLNLVVLLRVLGFDAYPVGLSTQQDGYIPVTHPSVNSLNYFIAVVILDDKTYLLDATDPMSAPNILPTRCLNAMGRIIDNADGLWIDLMGTASYVKSHRYNAKLNNDMTVDGTTNWVSKGYAAYRNRLQLSGNPEDKAVELINAYSTIDKPDSISVSGDKPTDNQFQIDFSYSDLEVGKEAAGLFYFEPVIDKFYDENPFTQEERKYPVEFDYPYVLLYQMSLKIPDEYELVEIPEAMVIKLPESAAKYSYRASLVGNTLNITTVFSTKKMTFLPNEYAALRNFYQIMIDKEKETVVFKKK